MLSLCIWSVIVCFSMDPDFFITYLFVVVYFRGAVQIWRPKVTPMNELRPNQQPQQPIQTATGDQIYASQRTSLAKDKMDVRLTVLSLKFGLSYHIWILTNPSKSEVIGRCGEDEKTEWPCSTDKSRTLKQIKNPYKSEIWTKIGKFDEWREKTLPTQITLMHLFLTSIIHGCF